MKKKIFILTFIVCAVFSSASAHTKIVFSTDKLPHWIKNVGARTEPKSKKIFWANDFGAIADGKTISTKAINKAIDECAKKGGIVAFKDGEYQTGAIFLKSNVHLRVDAGVTLQIGRASCRERV